MRSGPSRPNPPGEKGLRTISLSFVVHDAWASNPPLSSTLPRKPFRMSRRICDSGH